MPVPTSINDLSTTAASNSPSGSDAPSSVDDHIRAHGAFIAQLRDTSYDGSDAVKLTGNQTVAGTKTFSSAIAGSITGNAATATTASNLSRSVTGAGLATGGGALTSDQTITVTKSTQVQAEAGTDDSTAMTPLRTKQAIAALAPTSEPVVLLQTLTPTSGTTTLDIVGLPTSGYREIMLRLEIVTNSVSHNLGYGLMLRTSTDNGSTFAAGASDYSDSTLATPTTSLNTAMTAVKLGPASTGDTYLYSISAEIRVRVVSGEYPFMSAIAAAHQTGTTAAAVPVSTLTTGRRLSTSAINALRIIRAGTALTFSGTVKVYGVR